MIAHATTPSRRDRVLGCLFGGAAGDALGARNILGAQHGVGAIPVKWLEPLELRETITQVAIDLDTFPQWRLDPDFASPDADVLQRYPGW